MRICTVEGCQKKVKARGWCNMHWLRWSKTGDPGEAAQRHNKLPQNCIIPECPKRPVGRGLCGMHYERWRQEGDPGLAEPRKNHGHPDVCTIQDCTRPHRSHGLCATHYRRWAVHGDPETVLPHHRPVDDLNPGWLGDDAGYMVVHWRLHRRGAAKHEVCLHCDGPARHWAYDHTDPNEKRSSKGYPYSLNLDRYIPLCPKCHAQFDKKMNAKGAT